jgi:hypothetical protein
MRRKTYTSHAIFALAIWLIIAALIMFVERANATVISWDYNYEYTGATPPAGPAPWLNITIDDEISPGSVAIVITSCLTGVEFVNELLLNFEENTFPLTPDDFVYLPSTGPSPIVGVEENAFHAGGDGWFDVRFNFPNSEDRFGAGESVMFLVMRPDISAESFNHLSVLGPTQWLSVAHIGGIGPYGQDSGWITVKNGHSPVPEPDPSILLIVGLLLMGVAGLVNMRNKPATLNS